MVAIYPGRPLPTASSAAYPELSNDAGNIAAAGATQVRQAFGPAVPHGYADCFVPYLALLAVGFTVPTLSPASR